jgi:hypothetical protein
MQRNTKYMTVASMLALAIGCVATLSARDARASDDDSAVEGPSAEPEATCASGNVCIHSGTTKTSSITNTYFQYACYKLFNQHGSHLVENNQTGEASVAFYTGSNCEESTLLEGWAAPLHLVVNLEPANSVKVYPQ